MTYGEVAALAGNEKAARAVGAIMRTNYDPAIPCHRVVRADGSMGGYNRGGPDRKRSLLRREKTTMLALCLVAIALTGLGCKQTEVQPTPLPIVEPMVEPAPAVHEEPVVEQTPVPTPALAPKPVVEAPKPITRNISMTAKQWEFVPSRIVVNQGDTVVLTITSDDVDHGFSLPAFKIDETLEAGKAVTVTFVADKKGTFPFTCDVFCGAGHSHMTGSIVVE